MRFRIAAGIVLLVAAAAAYLAGSHWGMTGAQPMAASGPPTPETSDVRTWEFQAQFKGPLADTLVQRWRDPDTGAFCYVYLPLIVQHSPPLPSGTVHYGANVIGSIGCIPPR